MGVARPETSLVNIFLSEFVTGIVAHHIIMGDGVVVNDGVKETNSGASGACGEAGAIGVLGEAYATYAGVACVVFGEALHTVVLNKVGTQWGRATKVA